MSHTVLSYTWHFLLALVWAIYIIQESFVVGVSMLSIRYEKSEVKKLNSLVGLHWDGIQVWLILAVAGLLAAFPSILAIIFSNIYIAVFLLLYAIVFRGISIELLYKSENAKFQSIATRTWQISSFVLILVVGVYVANLFVGLPLVNKEMNTTFFSFLTLFNLVGLLGGLLLVCHSFVSAYNYTSFHYTDGLANKMNPLAKWSSIACSVIMVAIMMGLNNMYNVFSKPNGLYQLHPIFWVLPVLAMLCMIVSSYFTWKDSKLFSFVTSNLAILFYIFTGFTSMVPFAAVSTKGAAESVLIVDGAAGVNTLTVMFVATCCFLPVVIGYQAFKYIRFWGKKGH